MGTDVNSTGVAERSGAVGKRALLKPFVTDRPRGGFQLFPSKSRHQFGHFGVDCDLNENGASLAPRGLNEAERKRGTWTG